MMKSQPNQHTAFLLKIIMVLAVVVAIVATANLLDDLLGIKEPANLIRGP